MIYDINNLCNLLKLFLILINNYPDIIGQYKINANTTIVKILVVFIVHLIRK